MKLMLNGKEVTGMGHYVMAGDIKDATAEDSNVLSGKSYYNNNGKREGTMPNRGGMSAELAAGGSVSILEGYHNGEGVVRAQDLASQTQGTAAAANIEAGYTAWVNGKMVEGTGKMDPFEEVAKLTVPNDYISIYSYDGNAGADTDIFKVVDMVGHTYLIPLAALSNISCSIVLKNSRGSVKTATVQIVTGNVRVQMSSTSLKLNNYISEIYKMRLK